MVKRIGKGVDSISTITQKDIEKEMTLSFSSLKEISVKFKEEMRQGLDRKKSSLKMLPAFIGKPIGSEKGIFLALDFGGTNIRVMLVELLGDRNSRILNRLSFPLKDNAAGFDYTAPSVDKEELFAFISRNIKLVAAGQTNYRLGHAFSFPCEHTALNRAFLLKWTKEIATSGLEGQDVGVALQLALKKEGINNVLPCAIINDTVGTLLTGAYRDSSCDIGTVLGTGHNTCYIQKDFPRADSDMAINIEAGGFNQVRQTKYDRILDEASDRPGEQIFEKMVAGKYLGELVRLILIDLNKQQNAFCGIDLTEHIGKGTLTTADISEFIASKRSGAAVLKTVFQERFEIKNISENDLKITQLVCRKVRDRSAQLAAAAYFGILRHMDPDFNEKHLIAVDGTLYEKLDGYRDELRKTLAGLLGNKRDKVKLCLVKDGSGAGAAIAAAIAE